jgi:hypothetical protein
MEVREVEFWRSLERRRNLFFYWWIGWPFGGLAFVIAWHSVFGSQAPRAVMPALLFLWFGVWIYISRRVTQLPCPRCSQPAVSSPLFFMKDARCRHCGYPHQGSGTKL